MKRKTIGFKRSLSVTLILIMLLTMIPMTVFAVMPSDIDNHWAKDAIQEWINKDLVKGYPDGTFKPDNNITRAEFMVLVNGAFGYTETTEIDYLDVKDSDWFADTVKKAKAAGYIGGYPDGIVKPNNPISREEAATIIVKIKNLKEDSSSVSQFNDSSSMSWSKGLVGAVSKAAIMSGYPDGSFRPQNSIKRAEAVVALNKALGYIPTETETKEPTADSIVYDKAGTYGPEYEQESIEKDVVITAPGVTLRNMIIEGDLIISKSVGEVEAYLDGVIVKGKIIINGGDTNSIYFEDSVLSDVIVNKSDGKVWIIVSGTTDIERLKLQSEAKLEEKDLTGLGFRSVKVEEGLAENSKVTLIGDFETFDIRSASITVELAKGNIQELQIDKTATNTKIDIAKESEITKAVIDAKVKVVGKGNVKEAEVNVKNVTFEKAPKKLTGTEIPKIGSSSGGGGGGGGSSSTPTKYAITIADVVGGKATVTADKTTAASWDTVTVTIADIEANKQFKSITVTDANNQAVATTAVTAGEKYTFKMPARAVTVTVAVGLVEEVSVSAISVTAAGGATTVVNGETLQMNAAVTPENATNKAVIWSVENGTGSATIDASGLLTGTGVGTVTVKAVAQDGSGVAGSLEVTVKQTYTITYSVIGSVGGSLSASLENGDPVASGDSVEEGSTVTFTVAVPEGYGIKQWIYNDFIMAEDTNPMVISDIGMNINMVVEFSRISVNVTGVTLD